MLAWGPYPTTLSGVLTRLQSAHELVPMVQALPLEQPMFNMVIGGAVVLVLGLLAAMWRCGEAMNTWLFHHDTKHIDDSDDLMGTEQLLLRYLRDRARYVELRRARGESLALARGFDAASLCMLVLFVLFFATMGECTGPTSLEELRDPGNSLLYEVRERVEPGQFDDEP